METMGPIYFQRRGNRIGPTNSATSSSIVTFF